jgi:hypothetical protein
VQKRAAVSSPADIHHTCTSGHHYRSRFPASHDEIYRVRAMDLTTPVDNFEVMIVEQGSGLVAKV